MRWFDARTVQRAARVGLVTGVVLAMTAGAPLDVAAESGGAADRGPVDRAELERLSREVEALRAVLAQMLEIERMRVELLSQSLKSGGAAVARTSGPQERGAPSLDVGRDPREARDARDPRAAEPPVKLTAADLSKQRRPAARAVAGTITGRVTLPPGAPVAYVFVENVRGALVRDQKVSIKQVNKRFQPEWAVVQVGTTVEFPNMDDIYHNVFSLTPGSSFDLGLYKRGESSKEHRFTRAGVVDIYCNIHPRMLASLLVVPNDHFARVKDDGTFELTGVPEGKRKLVAWAPGAELGAEWVDVATGSETHVELRLAPKSPAHKNKHGQAYGSYE
ncbi:hypothetical protein L6R52_04825 [Myxococcota bacterium]|nr:hypothetical protein [Myxococcota bacterium]